MDLIATFCTMMVLSVTTVSSGNCPEQYLRLSPDHTFCKPPNWNCQVLKKGVSQSDIPKILDAHNKFRSTVAMGQETRAGGLPTAANMLQLSWDTELAQIAQKWAEQCKFQHDCNACRSTTRFSAGQNIAYTQKWCNGGLCPNESPDWYGVIKMFYDEVQNFDKNMVKSVNFNGGKTIGHFTQVVWATTYKVGCGYVEYKDSGSGRQFYVCNYGPAGNVINYPLYKEGRPCSACPRNSCCGWACGSNSYPGLCRA